MAESNLGAQYFLVAAGGTGMRCLQSFINLSATGLFKDLKTVHILLMDTDEENKDKRNAENLLKSYEQVFKNAEGETFFNCELKLYRFVPDYSKDSRRNFIIISQLERGDSDTNHKLANIFFEEGVQQFDLSHGYRAQTHLGSYLMYHAFVEEIRKSVQDNVYGANSELHQFIQAVSNANNTEARIFAFGSSFGGTGASSIPVIPRAISDCTKIVTGGNISGDKIYYGGVVLSSYFKFKPPSDSEKKKEKVIANSQFFTHNSASALNYYVNDFTISKTYKKLYLLGWPSKYNVDLDAYKEDELGKKKETEVKTITGGKSQENPGHVLELFSATAAFHFFSGIFTSKSELERISSTQFNYKSMGIDESGNLILDPEDVISNPGDIDKEVPMHEDFRKNLIAFYSFGKMVHAEYKGNMMGLLDDLRLYNSNYDVKPEILDSFTYFLNYFSLIPKGDEGNASYYPGWLTQLFITFKPNGDKDFLSIPKNFFDKKNAETWTLAYPELQRKNARNIFIERFKKINKNSSGDFKKFVEDIRSTLYSFKIDSKLATQED